MALYLPISLKKDASVGFIRSHTLISTPLTLPDSASKIHFKPRSLKIQCRISCTSPVKTVRSPSLDRHVTMQNRIRFVQKLRILLLSKPKHFMPLHILYKCRTYLALPKPKSILKMIRRYPAIFELFTIPYPPLPLNSTKSLPQLCVRLTSAAAALAVQESNIKKELSVSLVMKLQKLLMLASHQRLLLSKLAHLAPDLGLPVNFRSRLCNAHPDKFKTVETSYGRALELVSWDTDLASSLHRPEARSRDLIVDRPSKFNLLNLRKGLNLKRSHQEFLIKFRDMKDICPYKTPIEDLAKESIEAEKRACSVVREILGMTIEKRTLIDHLTHFRKDFGLPNKLRGMIVRHPDLFYVSLKGQRDSVFLVEAYDDKGLLIEKDKLLVVKEKLMELVIEGKRMNRESKKASLNNHGLSKYSYGVYTHSEEVGYGDDSDFDGGDGLDGLFDFEDFDYLSDGGDSEDVDNDLAELGVKGLFWTADNSSLSVSESSNAGSLNPW